MEAPEQLPSLPSWSSRLLNQLVLAAEQCPARRPLSYVRFNMIILVTETPAGPLALLYRNLITFIFPVQKLEVCQSNLTTAASTPLAVGAGAPI